MLVLYIFAAHNIFAAIPLILSDYSPDIFLYSSFSSIRWCFADDITGNKVSSPKMFMASFIYSAVPIFTFPP